MNEMLKCVQSATNIRYKAHLDIVFNMKCEMECTICCTIYVIFKEQPVSFRNVLINILSTSELYPNKLIIPIMSHYAITVIFGIWIDIGFTNLLISDSGFIPNKTRCMLKANKCLRGCCWLLLCDCANSLWMTL